MVTVSRAILCRFTLAFVIVYGGSTDGRSHDLPGVIKLEKSGVIDSALQRTARSDTATRSVLYNLALWPIPYKVKVCFMHGIAQVRRAVAAAMRKWQLPEITNGNLDFDFGPPVTYRDCGSENTDISIGLQGSGYSSYLGVESRLYRPSMNLQGFETKTQNAEFEGIVIHETGHALGLHHEHQSSSGPNCFDEWNFDFIRSHYGWESEKQMFDNFKTLTDFLYEEKHAYIFSTYDRTSVMHYSFPVAAYRKGADSPCYTKPNEIPSQQDFDALMLAYGLNALSKQAANRGAISALHADETFQALHSIVAEKIRLLDERR